LATRPGLRKSGLLVFLPRLSHRFSMIASNSTGPKKRLVRFPYKESNSGRQRPAFADRARNEATGILDGCPRCRPVRDFFAFHASGAPLSRQGMPVPTTTPDKHRRHLPLCAGSDGPIARARAEGKRRSGHGIFVAGERLATEIGQSSVNDAEMRSLHAAPLLRSILGRGGRGRRTIV
jgi:hypothetical protein